MSTKTKAPTLTRLLPCEEVGTAWIAKELGVSVGTVYSWRVRGVLPAGKATPDGHMYQRDWAEKWVRDFALRRELSSLKWGKSVRSPEWYIYRLSEDEWGVMRCDETVFVAESFGEAFAYYKTHRSQARVAA